MSKCVKMKNEIFLFMGPSRLVPVKSKDPTYVIPEKILGPN